MDLAKTKNLIFDLGGVIIDLSFERTILEFSRITGYAPQAVMAWYREEPVFLNYEKGLIDSDLFRDTLRELFSLGLSDEAIDACWNAMLVGLPPSRLTLLTNLQKHFQVSVLSNTNEIHIDYVNRVMLRGGDLRTYVHTCHYSHELNMRKPDQEIYEHVLQRNNFAAGETLFLDDNIDNLTGAAAVGINTFHVTHPDEVLTLFKHYV